MVSTGYIHEAPSLTERAGSLLRARAIEQSWAPRYRPHFDLEYGAVWTQHVSACTGFAVLKAVQVMLRNRGVDMAPLSAFSLYTQGRLRRCDPGQLRDDGARMSDVVWAYNRLGPCDEWRWPSWSLSEARQKADVNWVPRGISRAGIAANARRWRRQHPLDLRRIVATGPRMVQRALHSLDKHQYVLMALPVGNEFARGRGVLPPQEPSIGWHAVGVLDWRVKDGEYQGLVGNSWGPDWGDDGFAWASFDLLCQSRATFYVNSVGVE